jgi:hypothetical protein
VSSVLESSCSTPDLLFALCPSLYRDVTLNPQ